MHDSFNLDGYSQFIRQTENKNTLMGDVFLLQFIYKACLLFNLVGNQCYAILQPHHDAMVSVIIS